MSAAPQADNPFLAAVEALLDAITFDDSGFNGTGGNGGLLSRETIRKASLVRLELSRLQSKIITPDPTSTEGNQHA